MKNVVCVDDCVIDLKLNSKVVTRSKKAKVVESFMDPREALKWFKVHPDAKIDLVFLDLNMPHMGGFEFLEAFSQLSFSRQPLICLLTSSNNPSEVSRAREFGAEFVTKPLSKSYLESILAKVRD